MCAGAKAASRKSQESRNPPTGLYLAKLGECADLLTASRLRKFVTIDPDEIDDWFVTSVINHLFAFSASAVASFVAPYSENNSESREWMASISARCSGGNRPVELLSKTETRLVPSQIAIVVGAYSYALTNLSYKYSLFAARSVSSALEVEL